MHEPVLIKEVVSLLVVGQGGIYVDGTLGDGGHAAAIVERAGTGVFVLGLDRDCDALGRAEKRLKKHNRQIRMVHGNYADMREIAREEGIESVDGVLLDVGVSSEQMDDGNRGFSLMHDGPLDMRMDNSSEEVTAADLVNRLPEKELSTVLAEFGEERMAARVARAIVKEREKGPILNTMRLAVIVEKAKGGRRGRIHPATQTFQALRIKVNDELGLLEKGLESGLQLLKKNGRMAVISFHSLEDRIVKKFFLRHAGRIESLQAGGSRWIGEKPEMAILTRKPVTASDEEVFANPRSRSAKLRVAEKVEV